MAAAHSPFEIFLVATPGLEDAVLAEALKLGFNAAKRVEGGVAFLGGWPDVWRANLHLRGAGRVLARLGSFPAVHLSQLDKRSRAFPWNIWFQKGVTVSVEAACKKSKIYHAGAAAQRVATAIKEDRNAVIDDDAVLAIKVRMDHDLCTLSVDTSGGMLHKRGNKEAIGKAPLRETLAANFLYLCGYGGQEPVVDPMCGSGTFVIEAAEMALGLAPGRNRRFAFEQLKSFDADAWNKMKEDVVPAATPFMFHGSDRDAGAIAMCKANAERAGVGHVTTFAQHAVRDLQRPEGPPGLVIVNPPYGTRIGDKKPLHDLYAALGATLKTSHQGWRVGMVTSDKALAQSTGLPFKGKPIAALHGGIRVFLFQTAALA